MVNIREARRQSRIPKIHSMNQKRSAKKTQSRLGQIYYKFST